MNKHDDSAELDDASLDDASIEALLQQVGARDEPSLDAMNEVRNAVHAEWQAVVRARSRQRTMLGIAMAAGVACAALVAAFNMRSIAPQIVPVATVARIDGHLQMSGDKTYEAKVGQVVTSGSSLRTDATTRAALDFGQGVSVRVDANSIVQLAAADRLVLEHGALYVDAAPLPGNTRVNTLQVDTTAGTVQHLGTQYLVRVFDQAIVVAVREGRVAVKSDHGTNIGNTGERLDISTDGNVQRSPVSARDDSWNWATQTAPTFEIADQPLSAFLAWVARETGRKLIYDDPRAEAIARSVLLHGSIAGLSADAALAAVLPTTNLRLHRAKDDSLRIGLSAD